MLHEVKLVADACVLAENEVLLVRYIDTNKYDHQPGWFLPDDYLQRFEHPRRAAQRILREQAGLEGSDVSAAGRLELSHVESFDGGPGGWHMVFHFGWRLAHKPELRLDPNIAEARWFSLDALPDAAEVAHEGWALGIIRYIARGTEQPEEEID